MPHGTFATTLDVLNASNVRVDGIEFAPEMHTTASGYEITTGGFDGTIVHITSDGRIWVTK